MPYLLNVAYLLVLVLAAPWLAVQAWRKGKYREGFAAKFCGRVPVRQGDCPCVWLHAVSVGEVNLLATLIAELRIRHPQWELVISTTTMTGYALARAKYGASAVFYCPLDFTWAVRTAMRRIRPNLLVLAELELWPNLIAAARSAGARVAIINGRLGDHSFRGYRRIQRWVAPVLKQIDLIAAQNQQAAERFLALGAVADAVHVTGSLKFDGARTDRDNPDTLRLGKLAGIAASDVVFLAGSTQEPEEELALAAYRQLRGQFPHLRLLIVPRHPDRFERVAEAIRASELPWQRRSELDARLPDPLARVLLVDRVGELGAWWGTARVAFVGGSMGTRGGQNMIEPAAYGAAVSFGPRTHNFRDVVAALLQRQAAVVVHDGGQLTDFVARCLREPRFADELGARARQVVAANLGATGRTADRLEPLFAHAGSSPGAGRQAA